MNVVKTKLLVERERSERELLKFSSLLFVVRCVIYFWGIYIEGGER